MIRLAGQVLLVSPSHLCAESGQIELVNHEAAIFMMHDSLLIINLRPRLESSLHNAYSNTTMPE